MTESSEKLSSRWSKLLAICAALPDIQDLERISAEVVRRMTAFFDGDISALFLRRDAMLVPMAWTGIAEPPSPALSVASSGQIRRRLNGLLSPAQCRRYMSEAMFSGSQTVGYLAVCSPDSSHAPYSWEEREMLRLMAHRVALSVVAIQALEASRARQESLARIAAAIAGEVEVAKIAQTAADLVVDELGMDGVKVWVARPGERVLELLVSRGYEESVLEQVRRLPFESATIAGLAATTRRRQVVRDVERMPQSLAASRGLLLEAGMRSALDLPLVARGELVGVLGYSRREPWDWEGEDALLLASLADLLAAAIFSARLYEESEKKRLLAEAVIENSPVGISVISGPEHRYVLVNPAREKISGIPKEDIIGRTVAESFPSLIRGPVLDAIEQVYRTGQAVTIPEFQYDFGPPAGLKDLSLIYAPLRGPSGQVEAVISLMIDITEQVAARRRLEELASRLQTSNLQLAQAGAEARSMAGLAEQRAAELEATISNIADPVFVCDGEGKIRLVNRAGREMIGDISAGESRKLVDAIAALGPRHPDGQWVKPEELAIARALRGEVVRGMEEVVHDARLGRDRYLLVSAAPIRDAEGRFMGAVEVLSDITTLKELDLLKDQFITVAAHEIKTPVTAIKGFAQTLARASGACAPKYQKALETIVQQSDRIDALVRDFLDVSSMRWGRVKLAPAPLDLTALVAECVARKSALTPKHQLVISRRDPARVVGDRERLSQVVENLLDNAVKFSPVGGEIEVRVTREQGRAVVSVRDHGVGIPIDRRRHLFERFYRAHIGTPYDYGGLGVGLYISREIVRQHGGDIWFESEEGKGSTFYFSLPLAEE